MADHFMIVDGAYGYISGCGKRSYQFALSTKFTFIPSLVSGKCKKCKDLANTKMYGSLHQNEKDNNK